jgi:hypothetical protein
MVKLTLPTTRAKPACHTDTLPGHAVTANTMFTITGAYTADAPFTFWTICSEFNQKTISFELGIQVICFKIEVA